VGSDEPHSQAGQGAYESFSKALARMGHAERKTDGTAMLSNDNLWVNDQRMPS